MCAASSFPPLFECQIIIQFIVSIGHYAIGDYVSEDAVQRLRLMKEDLYWEHCVFMLRKNSVLLESLNDIILRISASGLHIYWESMVCIVFYHFQLGSIDLCAVGLVLLNIDAS